MSTTRSVDQVSHALTERREASHRPSDLRSKSFILASASPRRKALLEQIGIAPSDIIPADIDETPLTNELPRHYVARVAREKCEAIAAQHRGAVVLAADTAVVCGRRILPKADTEARARACLALLSGRRHRVLSGVCVWRDGKLHERVVTSMVQFAQLHPANIDSYIASGEWEGKAGGYAIQGVAAMFVTQIRGSYTNIVGLPLYEVAKLLQHRA
jgi:septum formation protein